MAVVPNFWALTIIKSGNYLRHAVIYLNGYGLVFVLILLISNQMSQYGFRLQDIFFDMLPYKVLNTTILPPCGSSMHSTNL